MKAWPPKATNPSTSLFSLPRRRCLIPTQTRIMIAGTRRWIRWLPRPSTSWRRGSKSWSFSPWSWRKVSSLTPPQQVGPQRGLLFRVRPSERPYLTQPAGMWYGFACWYRVPPWRHTDTSGGWMWIIYTVFYTLGIMVVRNPQQIFTHCLTLSTLLHVRNHFI